MALISNKYVQLIHTLITITCPQWVHMLIQNSHGYYSNTFEEQWIEQSTCIFILTITISPNHSQHETETIGHNYVVHIMSQKQLFQV